MKNLIQIKQKAEDCPRCRSTNIKLFTPNDENKNEFFHVECQNQDCLAKILVVPDQEEIFILQESKLKEP